MRVILFINYFYYMEYGTGLALIKQHITRAWFWHDVLKFVYVEWLGMSPKKYTGTAHPAMLCCIISARM